MTPLKSIQIYLYLHILSLRAYTEPSHIYLEVFPTEGLIGLICTTLFSMLRVTVGGSFPKPLTEAEEHELLSRSTEGDTQARNLLIEHNLRLVAHIIKKYYAAASEQDDLISIGTIGLVKAINTYKSDKGTKLATYTARCIENEILMHFRASKRLAGEVSLSDPIETDKEGNALSLIDIISADDTSLEAVEQQDTYLSLYRSLAVLDEREKSIISLRYGILGCTKPLTQREIADQLGISRSYISRIEKKALEKLRKRLGTGL